MTFAGRTVPALLSRSGFSPESQLPQVCPPSAQATGNLHAERPGTSLGHPVSIQPLASASRQRPQTGDAQTKPDPQRDRGVLWSPRFETTGIPCPQVSINIQTSRFPMEMGPLSYMTMNPAHHSPHQTLLPLSLLI